MSLVSMPAVGDVATSAWLTDVGNSGWIGDSLTIGTAQALAVVGTYVALRASETCPGRHDGPSYGGRNTASAIRAPSVLYARREHRHSNDIRPYAHHAV